MKRILKFCYKGDRDYVHGTDVVNEFVRLFSGKNLSEFDIKFSGLVSRNLELIEDEAGDMPKVSVSCKIDGMEREFSFQEQGEIINCRYDYDETSIIERSDLNFQEKNISLKSSTGFTFCENIVALNKFMLQSLFSETKGKWYFTRLELGDLEQVDGLPTLKFIKNFNFRLVRSDIYIDDKDIGSIYFSLLKSEM